VALSSEAAIVAFAYQVEELAAATYQSMVPVLTRPRFRQVAMSVAGVETRHSAVLAKLIPSATLSPDAPTTSALPTTTLKGAATTAPSALAAAPVYQVPGVFAPLGPALGPNSYEYVPSATTSTTG
jgi:hypothetical protein